MPAVLRPVRPLRLAFITSEARPFAKSGGLADVSKSLPEALARLGHEVRLIMPHYRAGAAFSPGQLHLPLKVTLGQRESEGHFSSKRMPESGLPVVQIEQNEFFHRPGMYGEQGRDYPDNGLRFTFFCKAALAYLKASGFAPDIVHANDWQSGLIVPLLQQARQNDPFFQGTSSVYTVHNLGFLGLSDREVLEQSGLGEEHFRLEGLEFFGRVSLAKAGLAYARLINTVSPTYRDESLTPQFGCGLDGLLRQRGSDYSGILNGIDYRVWDPAGDPHLPVNYQRFDLAAKAVMKEHLQRELGLDTRPGLPLIGYIGRLTEQKGLDLLPPVIKEIMGQDVQLAFLGTGELCYHSFLGEIKQAFPGRVGLALTFDEGLAHRIYAGSDFFLMPSRFEPCGLGQMIAMSFATPPIVTNRGGLADTVTDVAADSGNGFILPEFSAAALLQAVGRALSVFTSKEELGCLRRRALAADFSWETSARAYEQMYLAALAKEAVSWQT
ncbi:MAG: glycogen synthase [Candidatus Saganbacteria bacterium]|nr:glycogen synthase [Candidatus Saganbacteria bacterium]